LHGKSKAERLIKIYSLLTKGNTMSQCPNPENVDDDGVYLLWPAIQWRIREQVMNI
jgi:uncharacterized protein YlaN (UPF0358 family)